MRGEGLGKISTTALQNLQKATVCQSKNSAWIFLAKSETHLWFSGLRDALEEGLSISSTIVSWTLRNSEESFCTWCSRVRDHRTQPIYQWPPSNQFYFTFFSYLPLTIKSRFPQARLSPIKVIWRWFYCFYLPFR